MGMVSSQHLISICIANYNGTEIIGACLDSVYSQKVSCDIEIIVHDDASTDGSQEFIQSLYPDVIFISSKDNVGFCESNNRMARQANGTLLLLLNNDTELKPGAIQALLDTFLDSGESAIVTLPQYIYGTEELFDRGMKLDLFFNPIPNHDAFKNEVATVMGSLLLVKKTFWEQARGFPTWFESIAEDMYLCLFAHTQDQKVLVAQSSGYFHRIGYSFGGGKPQDGRLVTSVRRRKLSERNKTYCLFIFYSMPTLLFVAPLHLFFLFFEGAVVALVRRRLSLFTEIYLNVFVSLFSNYRKLLEVRRYLHRDVGVKKNILGQVQLMPHKLSMLLKHGFPQLK